MIRSTLAIAGLSALTLASQAQVRMTADLKAEPIQQETLAAVTLRTVTVNLPQAQAHREYHGRVLVDGRSNNVKGEEFFVYWGGTKCPKSTLPDWMISNLVDAIHHQPDISLIYTDVSNSDTRCMLSINWW